MVINWYILRFEDFPRLPLKLQEVKKWKVTSYFWYLMFINCTEYVQAEEGNNKFSYPSFV